MLRQVFLVSFLFTVSSITAQEFPRWDSNPGAALTIYLDFNGHTTSDTNWTGFDGGKYVDENGEIHTPAFDPDGNGADYTNREIALMRDIWARVAEDYAPFNVNVTTYINNESQTGREDQLHRSGASDSEYGVRAAIGGNNTDWYKSGAGGVTLTPTQLVDGKQTNMGFFGRSAQGSTSNSAYGPAFVFSDTLGANAKYIAECISHEVGHSLALAHDGSGTTEYYAGKDGWAPIMGTGYYQSVTQWSQGEYENSTNKEDDLAIINGWIPYRDDVFGELKSDGTTTGVIGMIADYAQKDPIDQLLSNFKIEGYIEQNTDVDTFQFTIEDGGDFAFSVDSGIFHDTDANLDVLATLYRDNGDAKELLYTWDDVTTMGIAEVTLSALLGELWKAGTYYLSLEGTGLEGVYTSYASIGSYLLEGRARGLLLTSDTAVPEPATWAMLGLGLAGLGITCRRRK